MLKFQQNQRDRLALPKRARSGWPSLQPFSGATTEVAMGKKEWSYTTEEVAGGKLTLGVFRTTRLSAIDLFDLGRKLPAKILHRLRRYPPEIYQLIYDAKPEIEELFNKMETKFRKVPYDFLREQQTATLKWFDSHNPKILRREHLEDKTFHLFHRNMRPEKEDRSGPQNPGYPDIVHIKRDFIGKLCQVIISDYLPDILPSPKNPPPNYGKDQLYELYRQI